MRPEKEEIELFKKPEPKIDEIFHNVDGMVKNIYQFMPSVDSKRIYFIEVNRTMRIYGFLMFFGALMILSVVITSIGG